MSDNKTHFGYQTVDEQEKAGKVAEVFHSVAKNYDIMNDVMSGGLHRVWKHFTINTARLNKGDKVLDIAGGTGDLSRGWAKRVGKTGEVWLTDINSSMLGVGRDRLLNEGVILPVSLADAEKLPFPDEYFDCIQVAGTNGKTSTTRFSAAILRGEGLKTALYTSPQLVRYPERLVERYGLTASVTEPMDGVSVLEGVARRRGLRMRGGAPDLEKAALVLLQDYRDGKLGRISLETPETRRLMLARAETVDRNDARVDAEGEGGSTA